MEQVSIRCTVDGVGGSQALIEDLSGNVVELLQPLLPKAAHKSV